MSKALNIAYASRICRFGLSLMVVSAVLAVAVPASAQESGEKKGFFSNIIPFGSKPETRGPAQTRNPISCPTVWVQPGTAAHIVYERGKEGDPMAVRYQVRFGDMARECVDLGVEAGLRIGVTGRALVGPKGTPGQKLDVPIRFVVMDNDRNVVMSTVTKLQVVIPPDQTGVTFTHVEELGSVPMPRNRLKGWEFRVGFDTKPAGRGSQG